MRRLDFHRSLGSGPRTSPKKVRSGDERGLIFTNSGWQWSLHEALLSWTLLPTRAQSISATTERRNGKESISPFWPLGLSELFFTWNIVFSCVHVNFVFYHGWNKCYNTFRNVFLKKFFFKPALRVSDACMEAIREYSLYIFYEACFLEMWSRKIQKKNSMGQR